VAVASPTSLSGTASRAATCTTSTRRWRSAGRATRKFAVDGSRPRRWISRSNACEMVRRAAVGPRRRIPESHAVSCQRSWFHGLDASVTPSSVLTAALLLGCGIATNVGAQSAANGRTLYGFYCQACHTADPSRAIPPFNLIMTAANDPTQITAASNAYSSQMGFINSILGMEAHRTDLRVPAGRSLTPSPRGPA